MGDANERRNSSPDVALEHRDPDAAAEGVGGRQSVGLGRRRGGGYLDSCNPPKFAGDPRLGELRAMGLAPVWLHVAETIGHEAFIAMWRIVDAEPTFRRDSDNLMMLLRPFRSYLRFQRNRYIESLHAQGRSLSEIQELVKRNLCEEIGLRHIRRLVTGS